VPDQTTANAAIDFVDLGRCEQKFGGAQFSAAGQAAMEAQTKIITDYNRAITMRTLASYATSIGFACISAVLIMFAPEQRTMAANIVAGAFLVMAAGLAGFARLKASAPGLSLETDGKATS